MTLEEVVREGRIMGISFFEIWDYTWGEVQEFCSCQYERERRFYKELAYIESAQAHIVARLITEGGEVDPSEEFYYWSQEERNEIRVERYKQMLLKNSEVAHG